jgi:cyclophilin family peptidyl-prolyl cis-trans isomerase
MRDRVRQSRALLSCLEPQTASGAGRSARRLPTVEVLESRRLLASLQPISNIPVPTTQGFVQPLLAASGFTHPQTFTVTSSNPDIVASIINGPFWTVSVNYAGMHPFSGSMTFQLFQSTTVNGKTVPLATGTVQHIEEFTNDGYFTSPTTGNVTPTKLFNRIANLTGSAGGFVAQGGGPHANDTGGTSGQPGTPFSNENFQQIPLDNATGGQLAMANANNLNPALGPIVPYTTPTNDTQFFITTGNLNSALGYNFTTFGQLLTGQNILTDMVSVPTQGSSNPSNPGNPTSPIAITAVSLSSTNPNGVLLIDTTQAKQGETAVITITATDSINHTTTSEEFAVTVGSYTGPTTSNLIQTVNFKPFANPGTVPLVVNTTTSSSLSSTNKFPVKSATVPILYSIVTQPMHGTITGFNAATGNFNYTPDVGFSGTDSFQFNATAEGPNNGLNGTFPAAPATSNPATETLTVGGGTVRQVGTALLITPFPLPNHGANKIEVAQIPNSTASGGAVIQVMINGILSSTQADVGGLNEVDVFGGRQAKNNIFVDPSVTVPTILDSGHGRRAYLTGGGGDTIEQSWFGHTTLRGGPGSNYLIGKAGNVRFRPSEATRLMFSGVPKRRTKYLHPVAPSGTFYKFVNHRVIPLSQYLKAVQERSEHHRHG